MCDKSVCIPVLFVHTHGFSWYDWTVHNALLLLIVIVVALAFDFTNGFHDTANAVAPTIATGALKPRTAVALSSVLNLVGAFLSLKVAATIASALVAQNLVTLPVIFAGLIGAICWNVTTWYFAIPRVRVTRSLAASLARCWSSRVATPYSGRVCSPR